MPRTTKNILSEAETQRIVGRVISALEFTQIDWMQPQLFSGGLTMDGLLDVRMTAPEIRLTGSGGVTDTFRLRIRDGGLGFAIENATATNWSSTQTVFLYNGSVTEIYNQENIASELNLKAGTDESLEMLMVAASTGGSIAFKTGTGSDTSATRFTIGGGASPVLTIGTEVTGIDHVAPLTLTSNDTDNDTAWLRLAHNKSSGGAPGTDIGSGLELAAETSTTESIFQAALMSDWADGVTHASRSSRVYLQGVTNAVAVNFMRYMGGDDGVNVRTSATVPTTSTLAASEIRFVVDASDQLVGYFNDAGTVRTFVLGTFL